MCVWTLWWMPCSPGPLGQGPAGRLKVYQNEQDRVSAPGQLVLSHGPDDLTDEARGSLCPTAAIWPHARSPPPPPQTLTLPPGRLGFGSQNPTCSVLTMSSIGIGDRGKMNYKVQIIFNTPSKKERMKVPFCDCFWRRTQSFMPKKIKVFCSNLSVPWIEGGSSLKTPHPCPPTTPMTHHPPGQGSGEGQIRGGGVPPVGV